MAGLPMFLLIPAGEPTASHTLGRILMLILPAGVVTFAFGAIHATGRWATRQPAPQERGVLKWIFIGVLVVGMGAVLVTRRNHASLAEADAVAKENAIKAAPMIQFTFTSVELREEAGARWVAMDYVEQVRGDCQQTFRYDARVPGFTAQTRKDSRLSDAKAGFAPVMHQRILWKLPDSLPQGDALALRDLVAKEWIGKSAAIEPGDERLLFKTLVPDGGTLAAAVGVRLKSDDASNTAQKGAAPSPKDAASAELWAPKLAPGEKPNLGEILQEARGLAQEGRYEEALQRQIWYHNHALEMDPAQSGVRLSFALSYWAELARRYSKAKDALVEVRDRGIRDFEQGGGDFDLFMEVAAINRELNEQDATYALFKSVEARNPRLATQCYFAAEDLLLERADYSLCATFIPSFQQRFEHSRESRERMLSILDRTPEANRIPLRKQADQSFIKSSRTLIEILVGVERKAEAESIRDLALVVLNAPELQSAVADAEAKVDKLKARPEPK